MRPASFWAAVHTVAASATLILGVELLGLYGMPGPRRLAALVAIWAVIALVFPARRKGGLRASERITKRQAIGLAIAGFAASFLVLESAAMMLFPDLPLEIAPDPGSPTPIVREDAQLRGRFTPGFHGRFLRWSYRGISVRINEHGFRDRPWGPRADGADRPVRLLALGDSFTFGTGVPEGATFLRDLERVMGGERAFLTFNAAVPGFGPIDELFVLKRHFGEVAPDLVMVGLYTGNDLDDVALAMDRLSHPPRAEPPDRTERTVPGSRRRSAAAILARLRDADYWRRACRICALAAPGLSAWEERLGIPASAGDQMPLLLRACLRTPDPASERVTRVLFDTLDDASEYCRLRHAGLFVVLIPFREIVEPGAFERALASTPGAAGKDASPDVLHRRLQAGLEERGIPVLDLLPPLRAKATEGANLFFSEGHLNAEGHREVAVAIAGFLRNRTAGGSGLAAR